MKCGYAPVVDSRLALYFLYGSTSTLGCISLLVYSLVLLLSHSISVSESERVSCDVVYSFLLND